MGRKGFAHILLAVLAVVLVGAGAFGYFVLTKKAPPIAQQCTMEAKICPDGTAVGRTGPNCEFAECPEVSPSPSLDTSNWKTYRNEQYGYKFQYPDPLVFSEIKSYVEFESSDSRAVFEPHEDKLNCSTLDTGYAEKYESFSLPDGRIGCVFGVGEDGCAQTRYAIPVSKQKFITATFISCTPMGQDIVDQNQRSILRGSSIQNRMIESITSTETATSGPTRTDDWKTYRNEQYGFEVKYPGDWSFADAMSDRLLPKISFGPAPRAFGRDISFVCGEVSSPITANSNVNISSDGKAVVLHINGEMVSVKGVQKKPTQFTEGSEDSFFVYYCAKKPVRGRTVCMQFHGWDTPIDETDIGFIESTKFVKDINNWSDESCSKG